MATSGWDDKTVIGSKANRATTARGNTAINSVARSGALQGERKISQANKAHVGTDHQRIAKLDRENEVAPPPKVAPSVGKAMMTARQELKLTQKDVAQKVNEKPSVIQDYEGGKAIPNPQVLGKLERALGVKLRGSDIGKPLAKPGAKK